MAYNYIVVDDEPLARKLVVKHCSHFPELTLVGECASVVEAVHLLRQARVHLIFLDIEMPELNGFDLLRTLRYKPQVIMITAHREYAFDAFQWEVLDYLLKPLSFDRLAKAVNKFFDHIKPETVASPTVVPEDHVVLLKSGRTIHRIPVSSILFVESLDDYVKVHLKNTVIITRENIPSFTSKLESKDFVRIHRSFLVAKHHVSSISAEHVCVGGKELPFGRAYKHVALALLQKGV